MSSNTSSANAALPTSTPASTTAPSSSTFSISSSSSIANDSPTSAPILTSTSAPISAPTSSSEPPSATSSSSAFSAPTPTSSSSSSIISSSSSVFSSSTPSSSSVISSTSTTVHSSTTPPPTPSSSLQTISGGGSGQSTITQLVTSFQSTPSVTPTSSSSSSSTSATPAGSLSQQSTSSKGLSTAGTIAVAVVVPIVAVALLVLFGLWLWRRRKQRKDAEDLRRKEVEDYGYNPNNDPTLPAVGAASADGPFEMREEGSAGYRGWGTTAVASSGRKASTTLSGGQSAGGIGMAYSEGTSPAHDPGSDSQSNNPLMSERPVSGEAEALGAMGPAAAGNRTGEINRGPSNASSSYSVANRSDASGEVPVGGAYFNNQYETGNPYGDTQHGGPPGGRAEMGGQPVIRDVQARRNTRIENPSHFPQQSAGISQNF